MTEEDQDNYLSDTILPLVRSHTRTPDRTSRVATIYVYPATARRCARSAWPRGPRAPVRQYQMK
jgi:hypothetical protein